MTESWEDPLNALEFIQDMPTELRQQAVATIRKHIEDQAETIEGLVRGQRFVREQLERRIEDLQVERQFLLSESENYLHENTELQGRIEKLEKQVARLRERLGEHQRELLHPSEPDDGAWNASAGR